MRKKAALAQATAVLFFSLIAGASSVTAQDGWQELKGTHFLIYSPKGADSEFSKTVLFYAEQSYDRTVRYFGSLPQKDFWLWDNRCKIYLYESQKDYLVYSKQPEWSGGFSIPSRRTIVSYQNAPNFLGAVLPHEMAHLIFREFVGFKNGQIPRWLDEGFAVWQEQSDRKRYNAVVVQAVQNNTAIPLRDLNQITLLHEQKTQDAELFYSQSQSMVHFLLEERDPSYFINFSRSLRDGVDFEEALLKNYKREFSTLDELEKSWKNFIFQKNYIK